MNKVEENEFLNKLALIIGEGDLDSTVSKAIDLAKEMGISPENLLKLSVTKGKADQYMVTYIISMAAAQGLEDKSRAYFRAGLALHFMKRYEPAEELYKKAIQVDPNYALAHYDLGILLDTLGHKFEAVEQYRSAVKADPTLVWAYYNLGNLFRDQSKLSDAEEQYRLAIKADSNHSLAYSNLGNILYDKGQKSEAEELYRQAIRIDPDNAIAHNNYAYSLKDAGRFSEAERKLGSHLKEIHLIPITSQHLAIFWQMNVGWMKRRMSINQR